MSVKNSMDWQDSTGSNITGCDHVGYDITLSEVLWYHPSQEEVDCYSCKIDNPLMLAEFSPPQYQAGVPYAGRTGNSLQVVQGKGALQADPECHHPPHHPPEGP